jgi:hypothetical protein
MNNGDGTAMNSLITAGAVLARSPGFETSAEEQTELVQKARTLREALMKLLILAINGS